MWKNYRLYFFALLLVFVLVAEIFFSPQPGQLRAALSILLGIAMLESIWNASRQKKGGEQRVITTCLVGVIAFLCILLLT